MVTITWNVSHFNSDLGVGIQVWQYVNGAGDGGFSTLAKDYQHAVAKQCGVGAVALALDNLIYKYLCDNNIKTK